MSERSSVLLPLSVAIALSALAGYIGWTLGGAQAAPDAGSAAQESSQPAILTEFRLPSLDGGEGGPADFAGDVLVVDFWATWCAPCRIQARILDGLREEYEGRDVHFIAVSLGEEESVVRKYVDANPFPYEVFYDTDDVIATGANIFVLPTVMVVDRKGRVSYLQAGLSDAPTLREAFASASL